MGHGLPENAFGSHARRRVVTSRAEKVGKNAKENGAAWICESPRVPINDTLSLLARLGLRDSRQVRLGASGGLPEASVGDFPAREWVGQTSRPSILEVSTCGACSGLGHMQKEWGESLAVGPNGVVCGGPIQDVT